MFLTALVKSSLRTAKHYAYMVCKVMHTQCWTAKRQLVTQLSKISHFLNKKHEGRAAYALTPHQPCPHKNFFSFLPYLPLAPVITLDSNGTV